MDIQYLLLLQNLREATGGVLNGAFELITKLGEASIVTLLVAFVYWCVDKREGIFLMLTFYYNRVINGFLKITACVYRPWIRDPRVLPVQEAMADATGYSFPSGHSANATSFFGGLAYNKKNPKVFRVLMVVLVLLVVYASLKGYPVDYDAAGNVIVDPAKMPIDSFKNAGMGLGFIVGWFLERRFINSSLSSSAPSR